MPEETQFAEVPYNLRPHSESEKWDDLRKCLADEGPLHARFLECLENMMNRKRRVNIAKVSASVGKQLGKKYGIRASEAMWLVAPKTNIHIEDTDA